MRTLFMIVLLATTLVGVSAQTDTEPNSFDLELVRIQFANELIDNLTRQPVLSPDGAHLANALPDSICIHTFASETTSCYAQPEQNADGDPLAPINPVAIRWSPDSTRIAMAQNFVQRFIDSDIWILDITTGAFVNATDDSFEGGLLLPDAVFEIPVDLVPIWSANGDLYFVRYVDLDDGSTTTALWRIAAGATDPALVIDLTDAVAQDYTFFDLVNGYSLEGVGAVSPDGAQLALLSRPVEEPIASSSSDGETLRVLIAGVVYTFDVAQ